MAASRSRTSPVKLVIVDDHALARAGLRSMLEAEPDLQIIGEAVDGLEAIQLCQRVHPDLVLMDLRMPVMDGIAATREIKAEHPSTRVIILTIRDSVNYVEEAREAGADAYLLKDVTHAEIASTIRHVLQGPPFFNGRR
jgi:DNA-binding NarL/FixJ family response regulator